MVKHFNEENVEHEVYIDNIFHKILQKILKSFYIKIFGHQDQMVPDRLLSDEWTEIGF